MTGPERPGTALAAPEQQAATERGQRAADRAEAFEQDVLALAKTPEERAAAFTLAATARRNQLIRAAAYQIAGTTWGKDLSDHTRAAVARYALMLGTDPVRHWEVLGGKLYDTAQLWLDLAASMPDYEGNERDYINKDDRVGLEENDRRRALRGKWNTPEDVAGICLVTIYRTGKKPTTDVNWAGNRAGFNARTGNESGIKDPIGQQEPGKTSYTRAFRRCAKQCWPLWFQKHPITTEDEGGVELKDLKAPVEELLAADHAAVKEAKQLEAGSQHEVAPGVKVTAGQGHPVAQPADPFAASPADRPAPTGEQTSEYVELNARIVTLLKHECFTPDDVRMFEKWAAKAHPTVEILRAKADEFAKRAADWDAEE